MLTPPPPLPPSPLSILGRPAPKPGGRVHPAQQPHPAADGEGEDGDEEGALHTLDLGLAPGVALALAGGMVVRGRERAGGVR